MGSSCCTSLHSNDKVMIEATTKMTKKTDKNDGSKEGTSYIHQEQTIRVHGKGINKEELASIFPKQIPCLTIEDEFRKYSENQEKKMEDEIRAISEKNERINREREERRLAREKRIQEKKEKGLPLSESDEDSKREYSKNRINKIRRLQKTLKRSKTTFQEDNAIILDESKEEKIQENVEEVVDGLRFQRQSTHREASPKKGLLKRSKTSVKNDRKVTFLPPKIKIIE